MVQFPRCELGQELRVDEVAAAICGTVVAACVDAFGDRVQGIILAGSLARDEATIVPGSGRWTVLGDAEFFIVFRQECRLPRTAAVQRTQSEIEERLLERGVRCPVDLSRVHPDYLARLEPHILAYELRECGRVVWGRPDLLALIPAFQAADIRLEDGWRLLSNRMTEYLEIAPQLPAAGGPLPPAAFYRTVKLYLDMATSFLLFAGKYEPAYAARAAQLRSLVEAPSGTTPPFPLAEFADRVDFCTRFKLQQGWACDGDPVAVPPGGHAAFWRDAVGYAHRLWRWELSQLTGACENLSDRELLRRWMRGQPLMRRVRGWVRVARDSGVRGLSQWPRWALLALQASPRHWVYSAAAEIFFQLPELVGTDGGPRSFEYLVRNLPSPDLTGSVRDRTSLEMATAAVAWNYRQFVAVTRA